MCEKLIVIIALQNILHHSVCDYLYGGHQTTTTLPEIIINKNAFPSTSTYSNSGYYYPVPHPPADILPPLQDEIPVVPIDSGYLPPQNDQPLPSNDFQPIQPPLHPVYGAPSLPKQNGNFDQQGTTAFNDAFIRVISMSCLDSMDSRFFRAVIQTSDFIQTPLVFPKTIVGCYIVRKQNQKDAFIVNLEGIAVGNCGVRYCANRKLCLNLRLPTVQGLQLPEDRLITLQCSPQHSIASVVRSLGIKTQKIQSRSLGFNTIASGGSQRIFRPHLALYRKGNQLVEPGNTVFFGEDLVLKVTIPDGDDWKYIKIGSVVLQQGIQTQTERKSATLVDNDGCRVESMKSICPNHPDQLGNKMTVLPFRAFLFQDVDGDEMLLSVRVFGCMHQKDCQQTKHCEEKVTTANALDGGRNLNLGRRKRAIDAGLNSNRTYESARRYYSDNIARTDDGHNGRRADTIDGDVQDYESHFDFRVVPPLTTRGDASKTRDNGGYFDYVFDGWSIDIYYSFVIVSVVFILGITSIVFLCVVVRVMKGPAMPKEAYTKDYPF